MDDSVSHAYKVFLTGPGGVDLMNRLKMIEAKYQMEGMKSSHLEEKGLAMAKIGVSYEIRTMLDDLSKPQKKSPSTTA